VNANSLLAKQYQALFRKIEDDASDSEEGKSQDLSGVKEVPKMASTVKQKIFQRFTGQTGLDIEKQ